MNNYSFKNHVIQNSIFSIDPENHRYPFNKRPETEKFLNGGFVQKRAKSAKIFDELAKKPYIVAKNKRENVGESVLFAFIMSEKFLGKEIESFIFETFYVYSEYSQLHGIASDWQEFHDQVKSSFLKAFPEMDETLFWKMIEKISREDSIDERWVHRLVALNEFLEHGKPEETYGNFLKNNEDEILQKTFQMKIEKYSKTVQLLNAENTVLHYVGVNIEENEKTFENFTKEFIIVLLNGDYVYYSPPARESYTKLLKKASEKFSPKKKIDNPETVYATLLKTYAKSATSFPKFFESGIDLEFYMQYFSTISKAFSISSRSKGNEMFSQYAQVDESKQEFVDILLENAEKINPVELFTFISSMGIKNSVIKNEKIVDCMKFYFKELRGSNPAGFVKFISETALSSFVGSSLTLKEWEKALEGENFDYELSPELVLPLFSEDDSTREIPPSLTVLRKKFEKFMNLSN